MARVWRLLFVAQLVLCVALLCAWVVGRTVSDRYVWSQFVQWVPTVMLVPAAVASFAGAWGAARLSREKRGRWARRAVGVVVVAAVVHLGVVDLRLYRLPLAARPAAPHLRILHWNITAIERLQQVAGPVLAQKPDVAILVNPHSSVPWAEFREAMGDEYEVIHAGGFVIVSRVPVKRYAMAWLGLEGLPPGEDSTMPRRRGWKDPGRAMFVEVEGGASGGLTIWGLDLPSEPRLSRWKMAMETAAFVREWRGRAFRAGGGGAGEVGPGFPAAGVVVGDLNIVRGAASLSVLLPGMRNAYDEAGAGYAATWPRYGYRTPIALAHVDQTFVGRGVRALRYEVVNPGFGYHQMQVTDIAR